MPTIAILCPDLSRNAFGRAYVLARVLARTYTVRVVGPQFGAGVWLPLSGDLERHGIEVVILPGRRMPGFMLTARRFLDDLVADAIYASKPYPSSYGLGLLYRHRYGVPLVLDIDDRELGEYHALGRTRFVAATLRSVRSPNHYLWLRMLYGRIDQADALTVSSRWLWRKFGGTIIPHGRETATMDPSHVDGDAVRREFRWQGRVVMFLGTPRPHKGVEDLIAAAKQMQRSDVVCAIVGVDETSQYTTTLRQLGDCRIRLLPMQPFERIPSFLAAADVVVIPQRRTAFAEAQLPAKLFDAMAMARPIVGTNISDMPHILSGCGLVVPPSDPSALAQAISWLLDHPDEATALGASARAKCIAEYSWDKMQGELDPLFRGLLA